MNRPTISLRCQDRPNKQGKCTVQVRISFRGREKHYRTKFQYTQKEWADLMGKNTTPSVFLKPELSKKRKELNDIIDEYRTLIESLPTFSFSALDNEIERQAEKYSLELFDLLAKEEKRRRAADQISSANQYRDAYRSLKKITGKDEVLMVDVTPKFLLDYESAALEAGLSATSISMYLRTVRYVFNYCINNDYLDRNLYPFGKQPPKYVMIQWNSRAKALEVTDMDIFKNYKVKIGPYGKGRNDQFYLDLFLFSYYTFGLNIMDIIFLQKDMLFNGFIDTERSKTKFHNAKNLKLPIRKEAQAIIDKYQKEDNSYIFGAFKDNPTARQKKNRAKDYASKINNILKRICFEKGINKHVTTYTARHTAANRLLANDVSIAKIKQLLGHADTKTTENYLANLPDYNIQKEVMGIDM